MYLPLGDSSETRTFGRAGTRGIRLLFSLAFAGLVVFGGTFSAYAACSNPVPLPSGYAAPCPVFSVSPASISQSSTLTLTATPQPGTDYIYTTAYYAKGSTWLPVTLSGNNAATSYSTAQATGSLNASILASLPTGTNYVVLWDWLWDATAQCYKGPGLNQCNTGTWRVQTFTLTTSGSAATVTGVSPTSGSTAGGTLITISGANFVNGATILMAGTAATNVSFITSATLTALTPAHAAGLAGVYVTNPDGQYSGLTNSFTYHDGTPLPTPTPSPSPISCTTCNQYYVATTGSDSNSGTQASPWKTIQHAIDSFSLGSGGTLIHVAVGTYGLFNVTRGGSASGTRLVLICDALRQCLLRGSTSGPMISVTTANYTTISGFDLGNMPTAITGIAVYGNQGGHGNSVYITGNAIRDIAQTAVYSGDPVGCPAGGMVLAGGQLGDVNDLRIEGNVINNGGLMGISCSEFHGIYVSKGAIIRNNLISNINGFGIQYYPSPCGGTIANNTIFHVQRNGILLGTGAFNSCPSLGTNTVINNIVVNSGFLGSNYGIEEYGGVGTNNIYYNNLLQGNTPNDTIHLVSSPTTAVQNTLHESVGNTFINYLDSGSGDYHLKAGSIAINGGTTACVSAGISPCVPTTDITGKTRTAPIDIGAYEF